MLVLVLFLMGVVWTPRAVRCADLATDQVRIVTRIEPPVLVLGGDAAGGNSIRTKSLKVLLELRAHVCADRWHSFHVEGPWRRSSLVKRSLLPGSRALRTRVSSSK